MTTSVFDPIDYKRSTREQWQAAAQAWHEWGPFIEAWLGEATELMLDMTQIRTGSRALDVAAGAGGQTLAVARRVGTTGRVLATDIAPNLLAFVDHEAEAAGLATVSTRVMDGEQLEVEPGYFDAVISRLGLIYFPDRQRALTGTARRCDPEDASARSSIPRPRPTSFLDPGLGHQGQGKAAAAAARTAGPIQSRSAGRARERSRRRRVRRGGCPRAQRPTDPAHRRRLRSVRTRIIRCPSSDACLARRARARRRLARDHHPVAAIRGRAGIRGTLRTAGGKGVNPGRNAVRRATSSVLGGCHGHKIRNRLRHRRLGKLQAQADCRGTRGQVTPAVGSRPSSAARPLLGKPFRGAAVASGSRRAVS